MSFQNLSLAFLFAFAGLLVSENASAQERMKYPDQPSKSEPSEKTEFSVKELMKTERGRELVEQLRVLRSSEATMGKKHPLLPKIKEEIDQVKGLLRNWAVSEKIADEMDDKNVVKQLATVVPGMDDNDLRRLVLRLIIRVDLLEREVKALKAKGQDSENTAASDSAVAAPKQAEQPQPATESDNADTDEGEEEDLFSGNLFDET